MQLLATPSNLSRPSKTEIFLTKIRKPHRARHQGIPYTYRPPRRTIAILAPRSIGQRPGENDGVNLVGDECTEIQTREALDTLAYSSDGIQEVSRDLGQRIVAQGRVLAAGEAEILKKGKIKTSQVGKCARQELEIPEEPEMLAALVWSTDIVVAEEYQAPREHERLDTREVRPRQSRCVGQNVLLEESINQGLALDEKSTGRVQHVGCFFVARLDHLCQLNLNG